MEKIIALLSDLPDDSLLKFNLTRLMNAAIADAKRGGEVGKALIDVAQAGRNTSDTAFGKMDPTLAASLVGGMNMLHGIVAPKVK